MSSTNTTMELCTCGATPTMKVRAAELRLIKLAQRLRNTCPDHSAQKDVILEEIREVQAWVDEFKLLHKDSFQQRPFAL